MTEPAKGTYEHIGHINISIPGLPSGGQVYEVDPPINGNGRVVLLNIKGYTVLLAMDRRNQSIGAKAISTLSGLYGEREFFQLLGYRCSERHHSPLTGKGSHGGEGAWIERKAKRERG